jgi:hypothetical protein
MIDRPMTRDEARAIRYRRWGGDPAGRPWNPERCAESVSDGGRSVLSHQCNHKPGYGPDDLYCKQHAERLSHRAEGTP